MFLLASVFASGQHHFFGLSFGPGYTTTKQPDALPEPAKIGFYVDLNYQYRINRFFKLQSGLAYETKGSNAGNPFWCTVGEDENPYNVHFDYQYLTLPLLANLQFGRQVQFNTYLGGYLSYMIQANARADDNIRNNYILSVAENHNEYDWGMIWGIGIQVNLTEKISVPLDFKNHIGLQNVSKGVDKYGNVLSSFHHAYYLTVGLQYVID